MVVDSLYVRDVVNVSITNEFSEPGLGRSVGSNTGPQTLTFKDPKIFHDCCTGVPSDRCSIGYDWSDK